MSDAWLPHPPSVDAKRWLGRYGAKPEEFFKCPVCTNGTAAVRHSFGQWPEFSCSACPPGTTVKDLMNVWPMESKDTAQSIQNKPNTIIPGDPSYKPAVSIIHLGYDERNRYYYRNSLTGHIVELTPAQHKEDWLCSITPDYGYWTWAYGLDGEGKVDWKFAARDMMAKCQIKGRFRVEDVRGAGVWIDRGRIVVNAGTSLYVDGVQRDLEGFDSDFIYDAMIKPVRIAEPITRAEMRPLVDILGRLPFSDGTGPVALGGMAVIGMLSGILSWRPHLWLTGAAESGKSSILKYIIDPLWKPMGAAITDESTSAAGIRQHLQHSATPVVMDESEADDQAGALRVKSVVKMARSASSDSNAVVYKGTQHGTGVEYKVRSCFILCSIVESLTTPQDRQRFTVVQCAKTKTSVEGWPDLKALIEETVTPEFGLSLYWAVVRDARIISENVRLASKAVFRAMGNDSRRHSDQLGSFIAGYFYLTNPGETIEEDQAISLYHMMNHKEIREEMRLEEDTPKRCLHQIYAFRPAGEHTTIGQDVETVVESYDPGRGGVWEDGAAAARKRLKRMGLDVDRDPASGKIVLIVAVKHPELSEMLERRGFSSHNKLLKRLPGAYSHKTKSFCGVISHTIALPLSGDVDEPAAPEPAVEEEKGTLTMEQLPWGEESDEEW